MSKITIEKTSVVILKTHVVKIKIMLIEIIIPNNTLDMLRNLVFMIHLIQSGQIPKYGATAFLMSDETLFTPLFASIISWVKFSTNLK